MDSGEADRARATRRGLYPDLEPHARGVLDVGDGHHVSWESSGNPDGHPAVVLHGGPGSGCRPWHRRLFDPAGYRIVTFDQRGCGLSTPHAADPGVDLSTNTTGHLLADLERVRTHLGVDRWLVTGGSWGSALALAYAERHADRVRAMVLWGVTAARRSEFDWLFRGGAGAFFPGQWERLTNAIPNDKRHLDVVDAYAELLFDPDPEVVRRSAEGWCRWESATPSWPPTTGLDERFEDPRFALGFARLVTHYVRHDAWLPHDDVFRRLEVLAGIPALLIQGRFDFQSPLGSAWAIHRRWPSSELIVVDEAGHAATTGITDQIVEATDRLGR